MFVKLWNFLEILDFLGLLEALVVLNLAQMRYLLMILDPRNSLLAYQNGLVRN